MRSTRNAVAMVAAALMVGGAANAQNITIAHTNESVSGVYNNAVTFLDTFTSTGNFTIDSIGLYNIGSSAQTVQVYKNGALFDTINGATGASGLVWNYALLNNSLSVVAGDTVEVYFSSSGGGLDGYGYAGSPPSGNFSIVSQYAVGAGNPIGTLRSSGLPWGASVSTLGTVPEPAEWAAMGILGAGLTGLVIRKRRCA